MTQPISSSRNPAESETIAYSCACIGGYLSSGDTIKGLAWNAEYYLAEIDDFDTELRIEEDRMMNAIRWLLSQDVDVITSSCGYTIFDDYDGYTVSMLDGHSSRISQFVDSVLQVNSNLIFIQSMGNEGMSLGVTQISLPMSGGYIRWCH